MSGKVEAILEQVRTGISTTKIGEQFGVSRQYVSWLARKHEVEISRRKNFTQCVVCGAYIRKGATYCPEHRPQKETHCSVCGIELTPGDTVKGMCRYHNALLREGSGKYECKICGERTGQLCFKIACPTCYRRGYVRAVKGIQPENWRGGKNGEAEKELFDILTKSLAEK